MVRKMYDTFFREKTVVLKNFKREFEFSTRASNFTDCKKSNIVKNSLLNMIFYGNVSVILEYAPFFKKMIDSRHFKVLFSHKPDDSNELAVKH